MTRWAIADTGPLVAYFDDRDGRHEWAVTQFSTLYRPLLVSEPVLTEALFLLRRSSEGSDAIMDLLERDVMRVGFDLGDQLAEVRALMRKYRDVPMSLADACIVRMSELHRDHLVLTLDSDFSVYRRFGREPIPLITPGIPQNGH